MKTLPTLLSVALSVGAVSGALAQDPPDAKTTAPADQEKNLKACRGVVLTNSQRCKEVDTLKGIAEVSVIVEKLHPDIAAFLSADQLQTAVELRCRSLGLRVVEDKKAPFIYVNINSQTTACGLAYSVDVKVSDFVMLTRDMRSVTVATIYDCAGLAFAGSKHINQHDVIQKVLTQVDRFMNDWLAANPR